MPALHEPKSIKQARRPKVTPTVRSVRPPTKEQRRARFLRECSKLDPQKEQAFAEVGMGGDLSAWPEY